ncbi:MAG: TetR/AcrR family transcriptional regulator [Lachnospiraceae bacterium]|nr:TetR/AcrR family transcriptional regulator [Lachnospiraceae bacterium]
MCISKKRGDISTREKILDAASTLFAENGYDGTSVEQIANIVGIKAPSLYRHYMGKEDMAVPVGVDYLYAVRE